MLRTWNTFEYLRILYPTYKLTNTYQGKIHITYSYIGTRYSSTSQVYLVDPSGRSERVPNIEGYWSLLREKYVGSLTN